MLNLTGTYQLVTHVDVTMEKPLPETLGVHGTRFRHGGVVRVTLLEDEGDVAQVSVTGSLKAIEHWLFLGFDGNINEARIELDAACDDKRLCQLS